MSCKTIEICYIFQKLGHKYFIILTELICEEVQAEIDNISCYQLTLLLINSIVNVVTINLHGRVSIFFVNFQYQRLVMF